MPKLGNHLRLKSIPQREFLAELLGTFILILFGNGCVASWILSGTSKTPGTVLSVNWGWGVGVTLGVYASGGVSGGHLNPAVTVALALLDGFPWKKVPVFMVAQYLGAFLASIVVWGVYKDALDNFDSYDVIGANSTAGIFATYPTDGISTGTGFLDQVVGTAILLCCISAINDSRNMKVPESFRPVLVGLLVLNIGIAFGYNCGYAINPARDLGPRIFSALAGWGTEVFKAKSYWFWVPVIATHVGAITGVLLYKLCIALHWPIDEIGIQDK